MTLLTKIIYYIIAVQIIRRPFSFNSFCTADSKECIFLKQLTVHISVKKSFEDELKAIKTKNDSGAVSYENIRIFNGSLRWYSSTPI